MGKKMGQNNNKQTHGTGAGKTGIIDLEEEEVSFP